MDSWKVRKKRSVDGLGLPSNTDHADLIGLIIDERVTGSTIKTVERTDITSVGLVDFLEDVTRVERVPIGDGITSALFECMRTSLVTRVRFNVRMLYNVSPRLTPPW